MNSIILLGTSRPNGNTHSLANIIANQLECKVLDLKNYDISPFDYEHKNRDDDFLELFNELIKYDHIALATPVYWYSPSTQMKTFLDRLSDLLTIEKDLGRALRDKRLSSISTGVTDDAPDCFNDIFKLTANYLGMRHLNEIYCSCPDNIILSDHQTAISHYVSCMSGSNA